MTVNGAYTWYWGFEVGNTDPTTQDVMGMNVLAPGVRVINMVIHDHSGNGVGIWEEAPDGEVYGTILYNNGFHGSTATSHGHGIYVQNATGTKRLADNVIFNQFGYGIHAYGQAGHVRSLRMEGNVAFANSAGDALLYSGAAPVDNIVFTGNMTYRTSGTSITMGRGDWAGEQDLVMTNNYLSGKVSVGGWASVTFRNNVLRAASKLEVSLQSSIPGSSSYVWDNNDYLMNQELCSGTCPYGTGIAATWINYPTLGAWQSATGLDANSLGAQTATGRPSANQIFVRPNAYQPGRATIIAYNWTRVATVSVDVSAILQPGDQYEVRNAQDYFGAPVASGRYAGGSISLQMGAIQPPAPVGGGSFSATGPEFQVFVVQRAGS
jgi:hypothetical protein